MSIFKNRLIVSLTVFFLTGIFLLFEHFNGGVVSHHLLARKDLPEISNYWGLLTIPLLAWITISLIQKRNEDVQSNTSRIALNRFIFALIYGILLTLLWEFKAQHILQYFILLPLVISFFKPIHFPESLLGFVIGMIYAFGGILPIIVGLVLLTMSFIINKTTRTIQIMFLPKSIH
jgi:hypothetical protein